MHHIKVMRIAALCMGIFGFIFAAAGVGVYLGTARPETYDLRFAQNEAHAVRTATVTEIERSSIHMNNEQMHRLLFSWEGGSGRTNPRYNAHEARERVGTAIRVRVSENGYAVPVDYQRSGLSLLGYVFLGVFGGIGGITLVIAAIIFAVARHKQKQHEENNSFYQSVNI